MQNMTPSAGTKTPPFAKAAKSGAPGGSNADPEWRQYLDPHGVPGVVPSDGD
jgi:hypothetical protein